MAHTRFPLPPLFPPFRRRASLAALAFAAVPALAQQAPTALDAVTVTGRQTPPTASVSGFGQTPLSAAPFNASVTDEAQMKDAGVTQLYDLTRLDAAVNDNYDAEGYWTILTVRGYTLDNRFNYRRDGLLINAETAIPLDNKQSVEVLEGTTGIQAGTSAPGGLVNLVVKRPAGRIRSAFLGFDQNDGLLATVDLGDRFGVDREFGWRLNAAEAHLDPPYRDDKGFRNLASLAADWRMGSGSLIEAEVELSRQSQPSVPGFSLLGGVLPDAHSVDPRINLNNQPWSLPVVMDGATGSLRWTKQLDGGVRFVAHGLMQSLHSDDRIAFPFGCGAANDWTEYCSDGTYDMWDYRSNGEHRRSWDLDLAFSGSGRWLGLQHGWSAGLLLTRFVGHFQPEVYNDVGTGSVDGLTIVPPDPTPNTTNTNRDEHSTEWHAQDAIALGRGWKAWLGLRATRLDRASVQTDGSQQTDYGQGFVTPWLALSREIAPGTIAYASWGQGVQSNVTPNIPTYTDPGAVLPAQKSKQAELGLKTQLPGGVLWGLSAFAISQPYVNDDGVNYTIDGQENHNGIESTLDGRAGPWTLHASAMLLRARLENMTIDPLNGLQPVNVPERTLKAQAAYDVAALPGLAWLATLTFQGSRMVLPDNSISIGGWTRLDLGARYTMKAGATTLTWRAGVDNVANRRAWRESPFQYGHVYLYPLAPAAAHVSVQADF